MRDVETLIVGGGPAGSSCAWELRRRGRECLILERQALPKFKLCAGWITPEVLRVLDIDRRSYPHGMLALDRIRVYPGGLPFSLTFPTEQYSIRRVEFDNWLLARSGAEVVRHAVRSIAREGAWYVVDSRFRCRFLVGAGGTGCPVKRAFFGFDRGRLVLTQEAEFEAEALDPVCSLFYPFGGPAGYGWFVPKAGAVNVGFGGTAAQFGANIKSHWQAFTTLLLDRGLLASPPPPPRAHPYYVGARNRDVRKGNAFIVGDAAGLATADLGEGIGPAVQSGLAAARQITGSGRYAPESIPRRTLSGLPGRLMERFVGA